jgi:hypothetical protein
MPRRFLAPAVALALIACALDACALGGDQPYPTVPPPRAELVPVPPQSAVPLIWRPGHYDWTGAGYAWRPGEWVDRAGHGTLWQDGYWRRVGESYLWTPAHWM